MISTNKRFEERNYSFVLFQQEKTTFKIKWNGCIDTIGMRVYIYKYSSIHGVGGMATVPAEVIFWPFLSQFLFFVGGIHLEGEKSMWVSESRRESICQACKTLLLKSDTFSFYFFLLSLVKKNLMCFFLVMYFPFEWNIKELKNFFGRIAR